jgi:hypothetical protein
MSWLVSLAVILGVLVLPAAAGASDVSRTGNLITFTAAPGETNDVKIFVQGFTYTRVEDTAGLTASGDCTNISNTAADCGPQQFPDFNVSLGDGNDTFRVDDENEFGTFNVDGGPGDDNLTQSGHSTVHGGDGNDFVGGSYGNDKLYGDAGNDTVEGYAGNDLVDGGPGQDLIQGDGGLYLDGGSDTIISRDGEIDRVMCGYGTDSVTADPIDVIEGGGECESVDTGPAAAPGPGAGGAGPGAGGAGPGAGGTGPGPGGAGPGAGDASPVAVGLAAKASGKFSKLFSKAGFAFRLSVSTPCRGTGKIVVAAAEARRRGLGRGSVTLVSQTVNIPSAGTFAAGLTAQSKYRKKLRALRQLNTTLSFSCVANGVTAHKSQNVKFTR